MTENYQEKIDLLLKRAAGMPEGKAKVGLVEEAVKIADTHQDLGRGFEARLELVEAATFGGFPEKMLVAFPWLLARLDDDPERFADQKHTVLWSYKWILEELPDFAFIDQSKILAAMEDMADRIRKEGFKERTEHEFRRILAMKFGDKGSARGHQDKFLTSPETTFLDRLLGVANCEACELNNVLDYLLFIGEPDKAISAAGPILSGQSSCGEVPHNTYPKLLLPLHRAGRVEEAERYFGIGYGLVRNNAKLIKEQSEFLTYAAFSGRLTEAVEMLERHLPAVWSSLNMDGRFRFFAAGAYLMDRLAESEKESLALSLPNDFPGSREERSYALSDLSAQFRRMAQEIAAKFDARNSNSHYSDMLTSGLQPAH